ncbi:MAG: cation-transporting P-type ATPase [Acidobacteriia bacterium]|nr:cation-transporting P-type ATPase [Terriglobia bacterium]
MPEGVHGLTSVEAAANLRQFGRNFIPRSKPKPAWVGLGTQFVHFFAVMLWVAGILAIVAGMSQLGIAIFVVIIVNGLFAFIQEYRAERATERLRDLLPHMATVLRDGSRQEIPAEELVSGDLVLLSSGGRISADLALVDAQGCLVDSSTLTGESVPTSVSAGDQVFAGTFLVEGQACGKVTATGNATKLAKIAQLTSSNHRPRSPLALELDRVVRIIARIAVLIGVLFMAISVLVGIRLTDAILFAIGVTVALVPEGLLPTVTLSLAMGAQRMAKRNALVRRLESVETLGSTTFICTDKTGTLTLNQMSVVEIWTPSGSAQIRACGYDPTAPLTIAPEAASAVKELVLVANRCSNGHAVLERGRWIAQGNPMEAALDVLARRLQVDCDAHAELHPTTKEFPFDPRRKRMSVIAGDQLYLKGSPEAVLSISPSPEAAAALSRLAARGLRVIAVARRSLTDHLLHAPLEEIETDVELLGLVGIADPPREGVTEALALCNQAGIRVAIVTGDHAGTARAVAAEIGLLRPNSIVVEAEELPKDEALLGAMIDRDGTVICRVSPEDKLRIAQALRARGHVVAMTGDGVNDAPTLQQADIGVAMGRSGTDVAREAADLVLLDDNFSTIVAAIQEGRATFANVKRFLTYHLTDNVAELVPFVIWALSGGRFPLALGVLQVLALDIGTDLLPAIALGAEPPRPQLLQPRTHSSHLLDFGVLFRAFGLFGPVESVVAMAAFLATYLAAGWHLGTSFPSGTLFFAASGAAFTAVVLGQMATALACRSTTRWVGALGWSSNPLLLFAIGMESLALVVFLSFKPIAHMLGQSVPTLIGLLVALTAIPAILFADLVHKALRTRRSR